MGQVKREDLEAQANRCDRCFLAAKASPVRAGLGGLGVERTCQTGRGPITSLQKGFRLTCRETCEECRPGIKVSVGQCGSTRGRAPEAMGWMACVSRILRKAGPRHHRNDSERPESRCSESAVRAGDAFFVESLVKF